MILNFKQKSWESLETAYLESLDLKTYWAIVSGTQVYANRVSLYFRFWIDKFIARAMLGTRRGRRAKHIHRIRTLWIQKRNVGRSQREQRGEM